MSAQADKLLAIVHQLVGDIGRLPGVVLDQATEAQLVQLITDAFEQVGVVALDNSPCVADDCGYADPHIHVDDGILPLKICF